MIANGLIFLVVTWFADRWMIYHVTKSMRESGKATRRMMDTMTMAVPLHLIVGFFMISYRELASWQVVTDVLIEKEVFTDRLNAANAIPLCVALIIALSIYTFLRGRDRVVDYIMEDLPSLRVLREICRDA